MYEDKKNLLLDMIAFSTVDGHLNKEYTLFLLPKLNIERRVSMI
jgi:hypothetical protein